MAGPTRRSFIKAGEDKVDEDLWDGWIANDMDSESPKVHDDALTYGIGYVTVGTNEDDPEHPLITVESPFEMSVIVDPRTRKVTSAVRRYQDEESGTQYATVYLPNQTQWLTDQVAGPLRRFVALVDAVAVPDAVHAHG